MRKRPSIRLLIAFLFISSSLCAQSVYTLKADTVKITNCDSAELILENHTQGVKGFLYNKGNGVTEFRKGLVTLNDTLYVIGADTLHLNKALGYAGNSAHQVYMIYTQTYGNTDSATFTLPGWNAVYPSTANDGTQPMIVANLGILMYIPSGTPAGAVIKAVLQGYTIYTLTVSTAITTDIYAIGLVRIDQDLKYSNQYYVRGATETCNATGAITTTGLSLRIPGQSFVNPSLMLKTTSVGTGGPRVGCNYIIQKMQPGDFLF